MPLLTVKLIEKVSVARETTEFRFEKPEDFTYRAGQYADWTLLDPPETDSEGDTREFTFSSAPFEPYLACTMRHRDTAFKRVLADMPIGTEVELDAPYGSFVLHRRAERPAVFITGGVGITPVRSILLQADHDATAHKILVLSSNKTPADAVYLDELLAIDRTNPHITVVPRMTSPEAAAQGWTGHTGRIDAAMVSRFVRDPAEPIFYLCGPGAMVAAMHDVLGEVGVDDDDIRTEEFLGY